ncbi:MAG: DUF805 domain-containing protein [Alphaproteobacteria bacterium]|nr:DUF805 domain-containing protein [Alphaproteobacteria bacterium]
MGFGQAIGSCFKNYIGFEGRACRSEYWFFVLFAILGGLVTGVLDLVLFPGNQVSPINALFSLALFLPSLAVGARRLHDIDKSGFWLLLWLLPIIGWIILIVWAIKRGDEANNRFGSDPLALAAV